mmetsp:Transcript_15728/g.37993  ORF Transcript_15728/g.37993 Transcript_15728/m.37993 type:complete len:184 (+) Transcript_15728:202-753(+)
MMTIPTQASGLRPLWKDLVSGSTAPAVALAVVAFLLVTLDTELIEAVPEVVVAMLAASVAALYRTQGSSCIGGAERASVCKEWVSDDAEDYVTTLDDSACGAAGTPIRARGARGGIKSKKKRAKAGNRGKWISFDDRVLMCAKFVFEGYPEESTTEDDSPGDGLPKCSSTEGSVQDGPSEDSE